MKFILGFAMLLAYQLLGEVLVILFELPVSGPVIGLLLLLATLIIRGRVGESLTTSSTHLLSHLSLMFIPAGVGLMTHYQLLTSEWLAISVALVVGTLLMLASCALIMQFLLKRFQAEAFDDQ
ncbi:CidA/LrgA family protein [Thalassotalea ponticola]|uniref:CidA/LrgA family protein n=1 Tax=Thalassotalea ponticola TaxID=1523392 RepID=UPI0025B52CB3|nr:CidA/LrgA family protein [Thalassotalea ponticola]MDN3652373.1 CidA/LrgA family protein [Thalassotalea ponticola]